MNQFKKAKVIMLPIINGILFVNKFNKMFVNNNYREEKTYNLYITSDDKIEKGDYFYNTELKTIVKATSIKYPNERNKIIATTDNSLHIPFITPGNENLDVYEYSILPQPSQEFIEQYIESYNKGKVITEVLVEYEYEDFLFWSRCENDIEVYNKVKINQGNTINIKPIKDSWNREEVEMELNKLLNEILISKRNLSLINSPDSNKIAYYLYKREL